MKKILKTAADFLKKVFGYGIFATLMAGGLTFVGYLAAFIAGGDTAVQICEFIYEKIVPIIVYATNAMIILGILAMYLAGEYSLTPDKKKDKKAQ